MHSTWWVIGKMPAGTSHEKDQVRGSISALCPGVRRPRASNDRHDRRSVGCGMAVSSTSRPPPGLRVMPISSPVPRRSGQFADWPGHSRMRCRFQRHPGQLPHPGLDRHCHWPRPTALRPMSRSLRGPSSSVWGDRTRLHRRRCSSRPTTRPTSLAPSWSSTAACPYEIGRQSEGPCHACVTSASVARLGRRVTFCRPPVMMLTPTHIARPRCWSRNRSQAALCAVQLAAVHGRARRQGSAYALKAAADIIVVTGPEQCVSGCVRVEDAKGAVVGDADRRSGDVALARSRAARPPPPAAGWPAVLPRDIARSPAERARRATEPRCRPGRLDTCGVRSGGPVSSDDQSMVRVRCLISIEARRQAGEVGR